MSIGSPILWLRGCLLDRKGVKYSVLSLELSDRLISSRWRQLSSLSEGRETVSPFVLWLSYSVHAHGKLSRIQLEQLSDSKLDSSRNMRNTPYSAIVE